MRENSDQMVSSQTKLCTLWTVDPTESNQKDYEDSTGDTTTNSGRYCGMGKAQERQTDMEKLLIKEVANEIFKILRYTTSTMEQESTRTNST